MKLEDNGRGQNVKGPAPKALGLRRMGSQRAFNGIGIEWHEKSFAEESQTVNRLEGWYMPTYGRILIIELATWNFRPVKGRRV